MKRRRARINNLVAGLVGIGVIAIGCYLVFGGSLPFGGSPFVLNAVFRVDTNLHVPSPVRIAGVNVGQVTGVRRLASGSHAAVVTMEIQQNGLPIHADATVRIRPRIFLEGNFYLDMQPGTPGAPTLSSGDTLPAANTSGPVQLDRVLSALDSSTRADLQTLLIGLGAALDGPSTAAQDAVQDPSVRGLTAGQALNLSLKYSADAFKASAIVNQALLGQRPRDLSNSVIGNSRIFRALASQATALQSLIVTFNATMATLASRQQDLSATIALLPPLLRDSNSAFSALDTSFAPTTAFAQAILPGVNETAATISAALPWMAQAHSLVLPAELGGLLANLTPAVQDTATTIPQTTNLVGGLDLLNRCFLHNVIPTGNAVIQDPPLTSGLPVYQELFQSAVGLAGAGQGFDGNGRYLRFQTAGGSVLVNSSPLPNQGVMYGNALLTPLGTRPAWPGGKPPYNGAAPCYTNTPPNLDAARTGAGP